MDKSGKDLECKCLECYWGFLDDDYDLKQHYKHRCRRMPPTCYGREHIQKTNYPVVKDHTISCGEVKEKEKDA